MEDVKRSGMMVADVLNLRSINAIPVVDQFAKDMLRNALAVMLLIVNIAIKQETELALFVEARGNITAWMDKHIISLLHKRT